ncbi:MAG: TonB family protein [Verrucomicrobiales bacterium]
MRPTHQPTVDSVAPALRASPQEGGPWAHGSEWFARLIGFQLLVVAFALAGSWSRALHSPLIPAVASDEVPVIDFPVEQVGIGPLSNDTTAQISETVETPAEPMVPELVEAAPLESQPAESPVPELVEALPAPAERPAAVVEEPRERPRPVVNTASNTRPTAPANPVARTSPPTTDGGTGTASSPMLLGAIGSGRFPLPPYPAEARRRGIEGKVMLLVEVSASGRPGVPRIESTSGSSSLDRAALDWIRARWRWDPGPVRYYRIPISYQIR